MKTHVANTGPVEPQRDGHSARSGIDGRKTEPMKTHVVNVGPRVIPLSLNGVVVVPDLESIAANQNPSRPMLP